MYYIVNVVTSLATTIPRSRQCSKKLSWTAPETLIASALQIKIPIPGGYLLRSFFPSYLSVLGAHQWSWVKGLLCTGRVVKEAPAQVDWEGCKSLVPGPEYQEWYLTLVGGGQTRGPGVKDRKYVRGWN